VGLGASLAPLDIAVNVALPAITNHFKLPLADVQWLVICYVLVYGSLMLVCGKLGDLFGHRLIFRIGLAASAVGCTACALAPTWPLFLWARAGQGIGTALALSCAPALATSLFSENERTRGLAGFAAGQAIASAVGPLLGGVLVQLWDWPSVYWVRVPIALVALAFSGVLPSPRPDNRPFDALGAGLLAFCMSTLLLALVFSQRATVPGLWAAALAIVALIGIAVFVRHENRFAEPILRPVLFVDMAFTVPNVLNVLANLAGFAILLLTPYYLVNVLGLSAAMGGLVLSLPFIGGVGSASLSTRIVATVGQRRAAFASIVIEALAVLALSRSEANSSLVAIIVPLFVLGVGQGLLTVAYTDIVTGTLARRDRGVAGALALLTRTLGIVSGASVLTALHAHAAAGGFLAGYRFTFLVAGSGLLAALLVSCLWPRAWFARA